MEQATLGWHRLEQDGIGWHRLENTGIPNLNERVWHLLFCFVFHVYRHKQIILGFFYCVKQYVTLFNLVMSGLQCGYLYSVHCTVLHQGTPKLHNSSLVWPNEARASPGCTVYSVQCTVYTVQCTLYSVHCTV